LPGTKDLIKADFKLTDAQTGSAVFVRSRHLVVFCPHLLTLILQVFIVVYMFAAPIFGTLSDRGVNRKLLLFCGVILWSLAAASAYFSVGTVFLESSGFFKSASFYFL
jgi:MFS family permease